MKIATYNINDVNKRIANLLDWLKSVRPDVACLQELKATDSEFPVAAIEKAGYGAVWRGQNHGTAWPSLRAVASRLLRTPRCLAILPIRRAATSRQPSTAC